MLHNIIPLVKQHELLVHVCSFLVAFGPKIHTKNQVSIKENKSINLICLCCFTKKKKITISVLAK